MLKFRVYLKKYKKITYDIINWNMKDSTIEVMVDDSNMIFNLKDVVIEKYTGMNDTNNNEIYEGDVVEFDTPNRVGYMGNKAEVFYNAKIGSYNLRVTKDICHKYIYEIYNDTKFKIIGNRYGAKEARY